MSEDMVMEHNGISKLCGRRCKTELEESMVEISMEFKGMTVQKSILWWKNEEKIGYFAVLSFISTLYMSWILIFIMHLLNQQKTLNLSPRLVFLTTYPQSIFILIISRLDSSGQMKSTCQYVVI